MDTAERRRAPSIPRRAPAEIFDFFGVGDQKTLKIFFACGGQLISILSLSQLFYTTLSVTRSTVPRHLLTRPPADRIIPRPTPAAYCNKPKYTKLLGPRMTVLV